MKFRTMLVAAIAAIVAVPGSARAQETTPPADESDPGDDVRFRGGIASEMVFMALVDPTEGYVGSGLRGDLGVQLGDTVGIYGLPYVSFLSGIGGGPTLGTAIMVDFTIADTLALGIGPELAYYDRLAGKGHHEGAEVAGRLHTAVYPLSTTSADGQRTGLAIGTDLRVMLASVGFAACGDCEEGGPLMLGANVFVGYEAY